MRFFEVDDRMNKIAVLLLPFLALTASWAQVETVSDSSPVEEVRRYTIEVVIFRYAEDFGLGTEHFYPDEVPVSDDELSADNEELIGEVDIDPASRGINLLTYAANADALRFELLPEDDYALTDVVDRLERLDVYETMMHFGWTQPSLAADQTRPIELGIFGDVPAGLQGSFSLYMSRYLHLVVDFALAAQPDGASDTALDEPMPSFGDPVDQYIDPFAATRQPVYFRISEDRIVKDGDTRYFDHPKFGILARITRVEEEEDEPFDADAGLLGVPGQ